MQLHLLAMSRWIT